MDNEEAQGGMNRKARRHAAKSARLAQADPNSAVFNPSAPTFAPFNHVPWDTFTPQAQDQTRFLSGLQHTPFWPTPVHHRISYPPNYHRQQPSPGLPHQPQPQSQPNPPRATAPMAKPKQPRSNPTPPGRKAFSGRDAIVPPSAASGGVPDPSPPYLLRASFLPQEVPNPHPLLVIIDLNGTLLHRPSRQRPHHFVARPHAREFLAYCLDTFSVMIWSSARFANVQLMCADLLTPAQRARCLAVWGREHFGLSDKDFAARVQCYKRLSRVWADDEIQAGYPTDWDATDGDDATAVDALDGAGNRVVKGGRRWDQGNTVLIDDSAEKARSEPYNAIQIPEFLGSEKKEADVLPQVHDYINILACQADVSTYIRKNPFKIQD